MCLGTDLALGVSVETAEQASAAEAAGADYLCVESFGDPADPAILLVHGAAPAC